MNGINVQEEIEKEKIKDLYEKARITKDKSFYYKAKGLEEKLADKENDEEWGNPYYPLDTN